MAFIPEITLRSEIICAVIMLFIISTSRTYRISRDNNSFEKILWFGFCHIIFDMITVITVNTQTRTEINFIKGLQEHIEYSFLDYFNWAAHIIFYLFALLFLYGFYGYIINLCFNNKTASICKKIGMIAIILFLLASPFLELNFIDTERGTKSSYGPAAFIGYGLGVLFLLISFFIVIVKRRSLGRHITNALIPILLAVTLMECAQIVFPQLLFTGGAITITSVGFFFSLENPIAVFRKQSQIDAITGVETRNIYEQSMPIMERDYSNGTTFIFVFCDINDLKYVNDVFGHFEGDQYISDIAQSLRTYLSHCSNIFRMGGDEFLAVYRNVNESVVKTEISKVLSSIEEKSKTSQYPLSLSVGYAISGNKYKNLSDVVRDADYHMYERKLEIKKSKMHSLSSDNFDTIGSVFDAISDPDSNVFFFIHNISTDVCHWSRIAVKYFNFDSEYVNNFTEKYKLKIHPDDRERVNNSLIACFSLVDEAHEETYRIKNKDDNYISVKSKGSLIHGKKGETDFFVGRLIVPAKSSIMSEDIDE